MLSSLHHIGAQAKNNWALTSLHHIGAQVQMQFTFTPSQLNNRSNTIQQDLSRLLAYYHHQLGHSSQAIRCGAYCHGEEILEFRLVENEA
jgi:hypothetical protein